jgi:hypothetical protein
MLNDRWLVVSSCHEPIAAPGVDDRWVAGRVLRSGVAKKATAPLYTAQRYEGGLA